MLDVVEAVADDVAGASDAVEGSGVLASDKECDVWLETGEDGVPITSATLDESSLSSLGSSSFIAHDESRSTCFDTVSMKGMNTDP